METVRSITAHIEVDTNKQTYELGLDVRTVDELVSAINAWLEDVLR